MSAFITDTDLAHFRQRYRNANAEAALAYAVRTAEAYADAHASQAPTAIKRGVAQLHFRYVLQGDPGERALLRIAIDVLLAIGRAQ